MSVSGRGALVNADVIMSATLPDSFFPVEGMAFNTDAVDGEWEFTQYSDGTMDVSLPAQYTHTNALVFTNGYSLQFRVRAREDARVLLMEVSGSCGSHRHQKATPFVSVYARVRAEFPRSCAKQRKKCTHTFRCAERVRLRCLLPNLSIFNARTWFQCVHYEASVRRVRCTQTPGVTTEKAYEFRIGARGNALTELYRAGSDTPLAEADSVLLLQEDAFVDFWIKWVSLDGE